MKQKGKLALALLLGFWCAGPLHAQNFGFSPSSAGQLEPWAQLKWNWTESFSGQARLESHNSSTINDTPQDGLEQFITTVLQQYQVQLTPVRFNKGFGSNNKANLSLGVSILADLVDITENGFLDLYNNDTDSLDRLFFFNNRQITAWQPAVHGSFKFIQGLVALSAELSYVPWIIIGIDHELSSASENSELNTPRKQQRFSGSGTNGIGLAVQVEVDSGFARLHTDLSYNLSSHEYQILGLGNTLLNIHTQTNQIIFRSLVSIKALRFGKVVPQLGLAVDWVSTKKLNDPGTAPETSIVYKPAIGFLF